MGYSRKNPNGGREVEDMEFLVVYIEKKSIWKFQGSIRL